MELVKKEEKVIYTFEMTQTEQLILLGLLNKLIDGEEVSIDETVCHHLKGIAKGLKAT